jgi:hypothetical protein
MRKSPFILAGAILAAAGSANAAEVLVSGTITTSTTWTKNNVYNLQGQVFVAPGAQLNIEAGTVIASDAGGSLAVTRGARINAVGTQAEPIIFTSKTDYLTWNAKAPRGVWRPVCNEWGNLTIMGNAYISENSVAGNTPTPNANNRALMEGLTAGFPGDPKVEYGGGDDADDSGTLAYCSFRYGGLVVGLNNELNGLSLGGIGRSTVINNMEIMNNVDDGIEIWGGTVNLKYFSVWNIGDDSLDIDQGWRGKAQFGLIVQGYSANAAQGSGVGDNAIEIDGAEQSDYQPVTTGCLYNLTVIGNPGTTNANGGDHGLALRDNARVQVRQSIFMDLGERLLNNDNIDGDGGAGYGFNGTVSFVNTWTTAYNVYSTVNAPANPSLFYKAQTSGFLNEIKDSVFFNNTFGTAYSTADSVGVRAAGNNNVTATASPIAAITRAAAVNPSGTLFVRRVTSLDPRASADAVTSVGTSPNDGFFTPVTYRGAFGPSENWLCGWSAADQYGFNVAPPGGCQIDQGCLGDTNGDGTVNAADLADVLANWGTDDALTDLNDDGIVGASDLAVLLGAWGPCN